MEKSLFQKIAYAFVLALAPIFLFSQQLFLENGTPSHPQVLGYGGSTRSIIDLNGTWSYSLDDGRTWESVTIPAAAEHEGRINYRRTFSVDSSTVGRNVFTLVSYGMNNRAEVYINETFIGRHEGGYTSFSFLVPDNVVQVGSENVVRVVVDNTLDYNSTLPVRPQVHGWKNYNGIVRDIFLSVSPKVWMERATVSVESIVPKAVTLLVQAGVSAREFESDASLAGKQFQLYAEVTDAASGAVVGKAVPVPVMPEAGHENPVQLSVTIPGALFWSPENPVLYAVHVQLQTVDGKNISLVDETSLTTGIRTITREKQTILFNAAPVTLRGVVYVEDTEKNGSAITYEKMERDVALIKNLGANAVRVAYHPPHPFFVQLCNRYGLLVIEEMPLFEVPSPIAESEPYRERAVRYLGEMIARDKHDPSVIAWGLGTAVGYSGGVENSIQLQLQRTAKSLDDRLTYLVSRGGEPDAAAAADIAALEVMPGALRSFRPHVTKWKEAHRGQPIILAGYGLPAEADNTNGYSDPMSEEGQARGLMQRYATVKEIVPAGGFIATFNDFRSDRPILSVKPLEITVHTTGIVALNREKKKAYDIVRSMYLGQKISALPIGTHVPSSPYTYVVIGLALLILAAWLINGNRRYRESTRRAIFNSYNFFADIRDQFTLPLFHTTVTAFIIAATVALVVSSVLFYFRTDGVLDYLLSFFLPDSVKRIVIAMAWDPVLCVGYLAGVMLLWFLALTLIIQILSLLARVKIHLFHSYSIAVWTALPWAFFIPVGMILYRILQSEPYVPWILGLIALMCLWTYFRTLKGISVIYHVYTPKMYLIGIMAFVIVCGGLYVYWDYRLSLSAYSQFFITTILPSIH